MVWVRHVLPAGVRARADGDDASQLLDRHQSIRINNHTSPHILSEGAIPMIIGDRLRTLREERNLSQGDIEKRTGLLRCYLSRVENGHTVPSVETLEKLAWAFEVPLYKLFYDGDEPPKPENLPKRISTEDVLWGSRGKEARVLMSFQRTLERLREKDRNLLLFIARKMASRRSRAVTA